MNYQQQPFQTGFVDEQLGDLLIRKVAHVKAIGWLCLVQKSKLPGVDSDAVLSTLPPFLSGRFSVRESDGTTQAVRGFGFGKFEFIHIHNPNNLQIRAGQKVEILAVEIAIQDSKKDDCWFHRTHGTLNMMGIGNDHALRQQVVQKGQTYEVGGLQSNPCHFIQIEAIRACFPFNIFQFSHKKTEQKMGKEASGNFTAASTAAAFMGKQMAAAGLSKSRKMGDVSAKSRQKNAGAAGNQNAILPGKK